MIMYIDTHLDNIILFLYDGKIIREKNVFDKKQNSTLIMPMVKELLGSTIPSSIVVCNGPGSFTGVRLGVTIAKTLAYTLNIPIRTITSLECMALSTNESTKTVAFNDKNGYYTATFDISNKLIGDYKYLSNKEFEEYRDSHNVITNVEYNYDKIMEFAMDKTSINPHEVNPIYIKKLDVEK